MRCLKLVDVRSFCFLVSYFNICYEMFYSRLVQLPAFINYFVNEFVRFSEIYFSKVGISECLPWSLIASEKKGVGCVAGIQR